MRWIPSGWCPDYRYTKTKRKITTRGFKVGLLILIPLTLALEGTPAQQKTPCRGTRVAK